MTVSRITLPQEFYDKTSDVMLRAPIAQYLYARMLYLAYAQAELQLGDGQPYGLAGREIQASGADAGGLDEHMYQMADRIPEGGAIMVNLDLLAPGAVGHTVRMNRPVFSGGLYTEAGRRLLSTQSISTTPIDLSSEQVTITVHEVAGPAASGATAVQPYEINSFDAKRAVHSLVSKVGQALAYDRWAYLDAVLSLRLSTGASTVYSNDPNDTLTSDATAFTANQNGTRPMLLETIFRAERKLEAQNWPRFPDGTYKCVIDTQQKLQLRSDNRFLKATSGNQPIDAAHPLSKSFVGRVGNVDVFCSNTNQTDTTTVSGCTIRKATMFGPGVIGYAPGEIVRVWPHTNDDYGRSVKVVWRGAEGFETLDNRGICILKTD